MICPECKEEVLCPKCGMPLKVVELEEIRTRDSSKIVIFNLIPMTGLAILIGLLTKLTTNRIYALIWMCILIIYGGYVVWYNHTKTMKGIFLFYKKRGELKW